MGVAALCCVIATNLTLALAVLAISLTELALGAKFKDVCPAEKMVPICLIVSGSLGLATPLLFCCNTNKCQSRNKEGKASVAQRCLRLLQAVFVLISIAWTVAGIYFVFHNQDSVSDVEEDENFCHPVLLKAAQILVVFRALFILFCIVFGVIICCELACFAAVTGQEHEDESLPSSDEREV